MAGVVLGWLLSLVSGNCFATLGVTTLGLAEASIELFHKTSDSQEPMTFVILEHHKFLETRAAFHVQRTRLAFSNLVIRRIYLSSRVFADWGTVLWVIGHELGHFVIRDGIEGHAEYAAERLRWRARQTCGDLGR